MKLFVKKLSENATIPVKGSDFAAGFDLFSAEDKELSSGSRRLCKTNLAIQLPEGCYGRIAPRSGLAYKNYIDVCAGVIDRDYRGDVGVLLHNNHSSLGFSVKKGDRVAQLILEKYEENCGLEEVQELTETVRGDGGYGSTGK